MESSMSSQASSGPPYNMGQSPYWPTVVSSTLAVPLPVLTDGSLLDAGITHGRPGGVGVLVAALFLVAEMAGAGVLNLPAALSNTGWSGVLVLLVLGVAVAYAGTRLSECWIILEEQWPEYRHLNRSPYQAIAFRAFGRPARVILEMSLHVTLLGASVVYLLLVADMLANLLSLIGGNFPIITPCELVLVVGAVMTPTSWLGTPKDFWWTPFIAVIATVGTVIVVVFDILTNEQHKQAHHPNPTFQTFFLGFASILFSLGGASLFPSIQNDMKDREKFPISVIVSFIGMLTMYLIVSVTVYQILGNDAPDNIIDAISGTAASIVQGLLAAHFFFGLIITVNPSMQGIEDLCGIPHAFGWRRVLCRSLVCCGIILTGLLVPSFSHLLDLLGGSTVSLMSFIFPPLFYWKLASMVDPFTDTTVRDVSNPEKLLLCVLMVVGAVGGVTSTYSATRAILAPGSFNASCFFREDFLGY